MILKAFAESVCSGIRFNAKFYRFTGFLVAWKIPSMTRRGKGRFGGRGHWRGRGRGRGGYGRTSSESIDPEVPGSQGAETEGTEEGGQEEQGEMEGTVLKEGDVGITEYISSTPGFRAIIKLRWVIIRTKFHWFFSRKV